MLSLVEVTGSEPLTFADAQSHLRLDGLTDEEALIDDILASVRDYFEDETGRQLVQATYSLTLDAFPGSRHKPITLPRPPLQSVSSITYTDTDGSTQTWSASEYTVKTSSGPMARYGKVFPAGPDYTWPDTENTPGAVTITFVAGYSSLPAGMRSALLLLAGDLYAHREAQITGGIFSDNRTAQRIIARYRLPSYA